MLRLDDVHVHIGKLHILQGVNLERRRRASARRCSDATASARPRPCARSWGLRRARAAPSSSTASTSPAAGRTRCRARASATSRRAAASFPNLTVLENLNIGLPGKRDPEREDYVFGCFPRLRERLKQSGNTLSGGEQQMLAIARCLMMRPKLIILDEPTEGIMPRLVSQIRREIHRISQSGVSILLVEQNVETALKLCPRVFLMEKGTIVYSGASHDLKSKPEIVHRYLGLSR